MSQEFVRNFCIIAHIDHGKTTLSDRLLEVTHTLSEREMGDMMVLDNMDLERERGITIKSHAIRMPYIAKDGQQYIFNLIDTPGHVDFTYEVSRALAACEGAILVVDATQGVQAQTISNLFLSLDNGLDILPVINKIDMPAAQTDRVIEEIVDLIGGQPEEILQVSARHGTGVPELLEAIVERVPCPRGNRDAPLRALIFDSIYDQYRGVVTLVRIVDGSIKAKDELLFMSTGKTSVVDEVGYLRLAFKPTEVLVAGDVGYIMASVKNVRDTKVGDTVTLATAPCAEMLPGYKEARSMVFCGIYPVDNDDFESLRNAIEKLLLNDSSVHASPVNSQALGFGFHCGFLGLLHVEIVQERLRREYNQDIIATVPTVAYIVHCTDGTTVTCDNPAQLPPPGRIASMEEPFVYLKIMTPNEYIGSLNKLCKDRRGVYQDSSYIDPRRVELHFEIPLAEILFDFFDKLKSVSRGYASMDYDVLGYREAPLCKVDILVNSEPVDALSAICHQERAYAWGRAITDKLRELIPRQLFQVAIQASIGSRIIARSTISPMRKNVTAKCYGGDISRKRKLLEKQKEGKKRMKMVGEVEIPQEAFLAVLKVEPD